MNDESVAVAADRFGADPWIRARRVPRAMAALWLWQSTLALLVAWPAASAVADALGRSPSVDSALFEPGGHVLLEVLARESVAGRALLSVACIVVVTASIAGLVVIAALMDAMCHPLRGARMIDAARSIFGAIRALPAFASLLSVFALAEGATAGAAWLVSTLIESWTHAALGEARAETLGAVAGATFAPLAVAIAIGHDLARASVIRARRRPLEALSVATRTLRRTPVGLIWAYTWRGSLSLACVIAAALPIRFLGARNGPLAALAVAVLHQLVVVVRIGLRASWLAVALRGVSV